MLKRIKKYGNTKVISFTRGELEALNLAVDDWVTVGLSKIENSNPRKGVTPLEIKKLFDLLVKRGYSPKEIAQRLAIPLRKLEKLVEEGNKR